MYRIRIKFAGESEGTYYTDEPERFKRYAYEAMHRYRRDIELLEVVLIS
jgi:hypothetical protein